MNTPARPTPGFPQGRQPHFPITLIGVNRPPLVSPRHDMVKGSGIFNSQPARRNPDFNRNPLKRQALIVDCRTDPFTGPFTVLLSSIGRSCQMQVGATVR